MAKKRKPSVQGKGLYVIIWQHGNVVTCIGPFKGRERASRYRAKLALNWAPHWAKVGSVMTPEKFEKSPLMNLLKPL
jgi:hypothetical protein